MALTYTPTPELGSPIPEFELPSVDAKTYSHKDFQSAKALVVMFICNHCPYVMAIEDRLIALNQEMTAKGVQLVGICANDPTDYPEDSPENLKQRWQEKGYGFPYLIDESQVVAQRFGAVCTPDFFVYDQDQRLAYRGRLDDSWKDPQKVTHEELKEALYALLDQKSPSPEQNPSMGCSIKWK